MIRLLLGIGFVAVFTLPIGCKKETSEEKSPSKADQASHAGHDHEQGDDHADDHHEGDGHDHGAHDGHNHDEHAGHDQGSEGTGHGHGEEADLGKVEISGMNIAASQGHGKVAPGKESHLVLKLPYSDKGSTVVRAWLGTEDRTLSMVGKAEYASSHDEYSVHAVAPNPLPASVMWWVEIEKPDGSKVVGSITPLVE